MGNNVTKERNRTEIVGKAIMFSGIGLFILGMILTAIYSIIVFQTDSYEEWGGFPFTIIVSFVGFPMIPIGALINAKGTKMRLKKQVEEGVHSVDVFDANDGMSVSYVVKEQHPDKNECASCGYLNDKDALFCEKCGSRLHCRCPYCGAENDDGARFCKKCGRELFE